MQYSNEYQIFSWKTLQHNTPFSISIPRTDQIKKREKEMPQFNLIRTDSTMSDTHVMKFQNYDSEKIKVQPKLLTGFYFLKDYHFWQKNKCIPNIVVSLDKTKQQSYYCELFFVKSQKRDEGFQNFESVKSHGLCSKRLSSEITYFKNIKVNINSQRQFQTLQLLLIIWCEENDQKLVNTVFRSPSIKFYNSRIVSFITINQMTEFLALSDSIQIVDKTKKTLSTNDNLKKMYKYLDKRHNRNLLNLAGKFPGLVSLYYKTEQNKPQPQQIITEMYNLFKKHLEQMKQQTVETDQFVYNCYKQPKIIIHIQDNNLIFLINSFLKDLLGFRVNTNDLPDYYRKVNFTTQLRQKYLKLHKKGIQLMQQKKRRKIKFYYYSEQQKEQEQAQETNEIEDQCDSEFEIIRQKKNQQKIKAISKYNTRNHPKEQPRNTLKRVYKQRGCNSYADGVQSKGRNYKLEQGSIRKKINLAKKQAAEMNQINENKTTQPDQNQNKQMPINQNMTFIPPFIPRIIPQNITNPTPTTNPKPTNYIPNPNMPNMPNIPNPNIPNIPMSNMHNLGNMLNMPNVYGMPKMMNINNMPNMPNIPLQYNNSNIAYLPYYNYPYATLPNNPNMPNNTNQRMTGTLFDTNEHKKQDQLKKNKQQDQLKNKYEQYGLPYPQQFNPNINGNLPNCPLPNIFPLSYYPPMQHYPYQYLYPRNQGNWQQMHRNEGQTKQTRKKSEQSKNKNGSQCRIPKKNQNKSQNKNSQAGLQQIKKNTEDQNYLNQFYIENQKNMQSLPILGMQGLKVLQGIPTGLAPSSPLPGANTIPGAYAIPGAQGVPNATGISMMAGNFPGMPMMGKPDLPFYCGGIQNMYGMQGMSKMSWEGQKQGVGISKVNQMNNIQKIMLQKNKNDNMLPQQISIKIPQQYKVSEGIKLCEGFKISQGVKLPLNFKVGKLKGQKK